MRSWDTCYTLGETSSFCTFHSPEIAPRYATLLERALQTGRVSEELRSALVAHTQEIFADRIEARKSVPQRAAGR